MPQHDKSQAPVPTKQQHDLLLSLPHRVQSAIALLEGRRDNFGERLPETESKHLRVGVNSAMVEVSALGLLLFRKKVITAEEYFDSIIELWEAEVDSYREKIKRIDPRLEI